MRSNTQLTIREQALNLARAATQVARAWRRNNPGAARALTTSVGAGSLIKAANTAKTILGKRRKTSQPPVEKKIDTQRGAGYTYVKGTKPRKRKGKLTLKKRIRALEKTKVPKSHYTRYFKKDIKLVANQNNRKVFFIPADNTTDIEAVIASVEYPSSSVNLTAKNTSIAFNSHHQLYVACGGLHSVQLRIVRLKAADNTSKSPIDAIIEELADRGITIVKGPAVAADNTTSYLPESAIQAEPIMQLRVLSDAYDQTSENWSKFGDVETYKLNPGDATNFQISRKFVYKPEVKDQEATTYIKNYDSGFLVEIVGELGHDSTNTNKCGYAAALVDCMLMTKYSATVQNGLGLHNMTTVGGAFGGSYLFVQAGSNNVIQ